MRITPALKMSASTTIVVGLNGALQKRFVLPPHTSLVPGNVHRAIDIQTGVGGKGQDVAVTLSCLQYSNVQLSQFIGYGPEGDQVYNLLSDMLGDEALSLTVRPTNSGMRTCTSIVASDTTTELVEPSGTITPDELNELYEKLRNNKIPVGAVCFMGSMPPGCPDTTYGTIYDIVTNPKTICVIDTMAGIDYLIQTIANKKVGSTIFKVNASELCKLAKVTKSDSEAAGIRPSELLESINQFLTIYPNVRQAFDAIAITDGSHPAHLVQLDKGNNDDNSFQLYQLPISKLQAKESDDEPLILFPIGAGDSVAAGLLAAWKLLSSSANDNDVLPTKIQNVLKGRDFGSPLLTSFAFGLACGSASCLEEGNSVVRQDKVIELFEQSSVPTPLESNNNVEISIQ